MIHKLKSAALAVLSCVGVVPCSNALVVNCYLNDDFDDPQAFMAETLWSEALVGFVDTTVYNDSIYYQGTATGPYCIPACFSPSPWKSVYLPTDFSVILITTSRGPYVFLATGQMHYTDLDGNLTQNGDPEECQEEGLVRPMRG